MKFKSTSLLFALFCFVLSLSAQNTTDVLHLRSGKVITGELISYQPKEKVIFKNVEDGTTQTYPMEAVLRVQQIPASVDEAQEWWILVPELEEMEVTSTVQLKDGTEHDGVITAYQEGETVQLTMENGSSVTFLESEIEGITYTLPEEKKSRRDRISEERAPVMPTRPKTKPVYEFQETGWFHNTSFAFSFGRREREDVLIFSPGFEERTVEMSAIGFNVQHIAGYHFSRKVGLGLGASYDAYDLEDGESILTLFGHYRGYLSRSIVAPFFSMNVGYGFALKNNEQGVKETEGGLMLHPEIGVRLGATDKANFTLGIGYRIQDAYYVQERPFNGNIEYRDVRYQRLLFSLGLLF